jgi:RNA polymerase sigma-70 factor (ECF subfamily)
LIGTFSDFVRPAETLASLGHASLLNHKKTIFAVQFGVFVAQCRFGDNCIVANQTEHMVTEPSVEFMDLFLANQSAIYGFLRSLIPYCTDTEEVFQQVALTMWRKRETFNPELGSFRAWAIGIARNHIRNYARQQARDRRVHVFAPDVLDRIQESWQEIDDTWAERQSALAKCIEKLEAKDRQRLADYYGGAHCGRKEMADAQGVSLRTLYRRIQRIRKFLLDCISKTMEARSGI